MRTAPVDGVRSTLRNFRLGGLAERAKATPVLRTYYGDTKYQLGNVYIFSDIIIYLWDKRSNWSTKNIYDWVTYNRANTIVEQFLNQFWNDGEISDIFLSRTFCPVCIIEFGHSDILSDYVRLPMQIKNPGNILTDSSSLVPNMIYT